MEKCIFCEISKSNIKSYKVYENEKVFAFFDIHPISKYHTLVIPKNHYKNIFEIPAKELQEVISAVKELSILYNQKLGIENIQIISSNGVEAQQDVPHIHFHIVPRSNNDGQDIKWTTHPEFVAEYEQLLEKLK